MPTLDKNFAGRLDRRVELLRPVTGRDLVTNEKYASGFEVAYSNFPAHRKENVTADNENLNGRVIQASNIIEWELRFIPAMGISTAWKLKDLHDGRTYDIISPVTEIGRRQGLRVKTMILE